MHWQRKRHRAQQFTPGEDVFHDYRWPLKSAADSAPANGPGGRPRFDWTPRRSRELIRLIIHTDIRFDDIAAAMKDESGRGPSESTCRDHWHEIFGYTPDVARLKNPEGRARRFKEHEKAFKAYCAWMETRNRSSTIRAEKDADLDDSFEVAPDTEAEMPPIQHRETEKLHQARLHLNPVQQLKKTMSLTHEPMFAGRQTSMQSTDEAAPDAAPKCPQDVERKYGLPHGFIPWIKGASISSTDSLRRISANTVQSMRRLSSRARFDSVANISTHANNRQPSVLSGGSMLCNYLSSLKPEDDVSASEVESLIRRGEDINRPNEWGETPLHLAVALGSITIVAMLLEHGADPKRETNAGETIWARGRRASAAAINPNTDDDYERRRMEIQRMICARIEFARTTVKYNPELITAEKTAKRLRPGRSSMAAPPSAGALPEEAEPPHNAPYPARPKLGSTFTPVQPRPCPEIADDSTTDSDWQTGSSVSPFTPPSAHGTSDTERDDLPPPPPNMILSTHHTNGSATDFMPPESSLPPSFASFSMSNRRAVDVTSHPIPATGYVAEVAIDPLAYAYNSSPIQSTEMMTGAIKTSESQSLHAAPLPDLTVQSPHGVHLTPDIDFATPNYGAVPTSQGPHFHHISQSLIPLAFEAGMKNGLDIHHIAHFQSAPVSTNMAHTNTLGTLPPTTQPVYGDHNLDYNTLMYHYNHDPASHSIYEPQRNTVWQPELQNYAAD